MNPVNATPRPGAQDIIGTHRSGACGVVVDTFCASVKLLCADAGAARPAGQIKYNATKVCRVDARRSGWCAHPARSRRRALSAATAPRGPPTQSQHHILTLSGAFRHRRSLLERGRTRSCACSAGELLIFSARCPASLWRLQSFTSRPLASWLARMACPPVGLFGTL